VTDATERSMGLGAIVRGGGKAETLLAISKRAQGQIKFAIERTPSSASAEFSWALAACEAYIISIMVVLTDGTET
jgi:hypothetical protein